MLHHLLGDLQPSYFFAALLYALLGVAVSLLIHATNRNPASPASPQKFSVIYLIVDNWQRIVLNFILIVLSIRFCKEITGQDLTMWVATLIGIGYDKLLEALKNFKVIDKA